MNLYQSGRYCIHTMQSIYSTNLFASLLACGLPYIYIYIYMNRNRSYYCCILHSSNKKNRTFTCSVQKIEDEDDKIIIIIINETEEERKKMLEKYKLNDSYSFCCRQVKCGSGSSFLVVLLQMMMMMIVHS